MKVTRSPAATPTGRPIRGVQRIDVARTADALLRAGERPTVEKVRAKLGTGSPNTINPLLDHWWQQLASRLEAGPRALDRLPEEVIHAAETLWLSCLDQARLSAQRELRSDKASIETKHDEQALRAELLSLREQELKARLADRDRTISILESETKTFATLFKKEQAKSSAEAQRIKALQGEIESLRKLLASLSIRTALKGRALLNVKTPKSREAAQKDKLKVAKLLPSKAIRQKPLRQTVQSKAKRHTR